MKSERLRGLGRWGRLKENDWDDNERPRGLREWKKWKVTDYKD